MFTRQQFDEFFNPRKLEDLSDRYRKFPLNPISVGRVRDFCDSLDHLGPLARHQQDLKDIQRCWMLKAILTTFPKGARLAEIGAGEPVVAGLLARLGYHVTVIDPYDGSGNGPLEFEMFQRDYPDVEFKREYLTGTTDFGGMTFDGFYSISVLEHVPLNNMSDVAEGVRKGSHPGTILLHAVDHVLRGPGAEYHNQMLLRVANMCNVPASALWDLLSTAEEDIETYFLSAESHNRWRGGLSYDEFPMRRCISIQIKGRSQ